MNRRAPPHRQRQNRLSRRAGGTVRTAGASGEAALSCCRRAYGAAPSALAIAARAGPAPLRSARLVAARTGRRLGRAASPLKAPAR
jgi:hypothetical protein